MTVLETVRGILVASGRALKPVFRPRTAPAVDFRFDINLLKTVLGFCPQESLLDGLHELVHKKAANCPAVPAP